jgi:hypothetical protein
MVFERAFGAVSDSARSKARAEAMSAPIFR